MHVLHEDKDPDAVILCSLLETDDGGDFAILVDRVGANTLACKDALFWGQPSGDCWVIWKHVDADECNDERSDTLEDEKPSPSLETSDSVELEDTDGDETGESSGEDVAGVQDCDSGCDLLTSVEDGQQVQCTWVEWRLCDSQEESGEEEAGEVLGDTSEC